MKNNIRLLISLFVFMAADAYTQNWCEQDFSCCEENCCDDETNFYARILVGANFLQNTSINGNKATYQTGYLIEGSLGYRWCYGLRVEGEYAYRRNELDKIRLFVDGVSRNGYFQTSSCMGNLLWDLPLASLGCALFNIQPFVGAGLGYDFQKMHASNSRIIFNQKWNHFSWQLMAGVAHAIFHNTEMTLEYKFHQGGSHFYNHSVGLGLACKFGS